MEKLITDGLDPLSKNDNGDTLLHQVASLHYRFEEELSEYVRWLLSLGIPINAVNKKGMTALHISQISQPLDTGYMRLSERVHFIHAINHDKMVDFNIRNNDGLTVLHLAVMRSQEKTAALITAGADLGFLTADSQNVLHLSCRARKPNIVSQILASPGALDIDQKDSFGQTPLHYACRSGEAESVRLLLKHGANVDVVDANLCTPLHACAQFRNEQEIWNAYEQHGTSLQGPVRDSLRPWTLPERHSLWSWYGCRYKDEKLAYNAIFFPAVATIAGMLIEARCSAAAVDVHKLTALDVASNTGCANFVDVLAPEEELLDQVAENLARENSKLNSVHEIRQRIRVQAALTRSRSMWDVLSKDKSIFDELMKSPSRYFDLLPCKDAARLITEGFESDPMNPSYYELLEWLMQSGHIQLSSLLGCLLLHYSTHASAKEKIEREREARRLSHKESVFTSLQLACQRSEHNMLTLELLVEDLGVDVNAPCANIYDVWSYTGEIRTGSTALHVLASADNHWQLEGLRYLLAHGANVNALDENGQSPIHIAAKGMDCNNGKDIGFWRLDAVRILLEHGAEVNLRDKQGLSSLHMASAAPNIVQELLQRGADVTAGTSSPLFTAIQEQNLATLEILLDRGLSVNSLDEETQAKGWHYSLKGSRKLFPLVCVAIPRENRSPQRSVPLIQALVVRGADLYVPLNDTETMIHFLFEFSGYPICDALLHEPCLSRIDFSHRDQRGRTILMAACNWHPEYASSQKKLNLPLRILDQDVDAALVDMEGKTALHHLLSNDHMPDDVFLEFIRRDEVKPTLFTKDNDGFSPLHYSLRTLRPAVCELILDKGANLLEPDPNGLTALHYITLQWNETSRSSQDNLDHVELPEDHLDRCLALWNRFIAEGGSINAADKAGNTPLHTYLSSPVVDEYEPDPKACHVETYGKLFPLGSGVDIFAVNQQGETALHVIARRRKPYSPGSLHERDLFQAMMSMGLDPLKEDAKGRSALDVASVYGNDEIVAILRRT